MRDNWNKYLVENSNCQHEVNTNATRVTNKIVVVTFEMSLPPARDSGPKETPMQPIEMLVVT